MKYLFFLKLFLFIVVIIVIAPFNFGKIVYSKFDGNTEIAIIDGYVKGFEVNTGDSISVCLNVKGKSEKVVFYLFDIFGVKVDSVISEFATQYRIFENSWDKESNYNTTFKYKVSSSIKNGLYLWENKIPFLVLPKNNNTQKSITIVIPFANMQVQNNFGGKSFYGYNSSDSKSANILSLERPGNRIDLYHLYFLKYLSNKYKNISFISDLGLEDSTVLGNTSVLVLYGEIPFISRNGRHTIDNYIANGGNILVTTSVVMNNIYSVNKKRKELQFGEPNVELDTSLYCWNSAFNKYPNYLTLGADYAANLRNTKYFKKSFNGYKIALQHPIFRNLDLNSDSIIKLKFVTVVSAPPIKISRKNTIEIDDSRMEKYYKTDVLAYEYVMYGEEQAIGSITLMQKTKSSGTVINLGSLDITTEENIANPNTQTLIFNCIDFLLNQMPTSESLR